MIEAGMNLYEIKSDGQSECVRIVASSMGAAIDLLAPSPRPEITFYITCKGAVSVAINPDDYRTLLSGDDYRGPG